MSTAEPPAAGDGCWHGLRIPDAERSFEPCDLDECSFTRPVTLAPLATCGRGAVPAPQA